MEVNAANKETGRRAKRRSWGLQTDLKDSVKVKNYLTALAFADLLNTARLCLKSHRTKKTDRRFANEEFPRCFSTQTAEALQDLFQMMECSEADVTELCGDGRRGGEQ